MESAVAGLAARRYIGDEAEVLEALAKHIDGTAFDDDRHGEEWAIGIDAYHYHRLATARSPALENRVRNLWRLSDFYLWQSISNLSPGNIHLASKQRPAIAKAIAARTVAVAESLMESHMRGKPYRVGIVCIEPAICTNENRLG